MPPPYFHPMPKPPEDDLPPGAPRRTNEDFLADAEEQVEEDYEAKHGKPLPLTPEEGVKRFERRVRMYERMLNEARKFPTADSDEREADILADLRRAKARLAEYQAQLKGRN